MTDETLVNGLDGIEKDTVLYQVLYSSVATFFKCIQYGQVRKGDVGGRRGHIRAFLLQQKINTTSPYQYSTYKPLVIRIYFQVSFLLFC